MILEFPAIRYIEHDNGIHEFIFMDTTLETFDSWYELMNEFYQNPMAEPYSAVMVDLRHASISQLREAISQIKTLRNSHTMIPYIRFAFLTNLSDLATTMMQSYLSYQDMRNNPVGYFRVSEREDAIDWLLG